MAMVRLNWALLLFQFIPTTLTIRSISPIVELKGIPKEWTDVKKGSIETNGLQHIYQNYLAGRILTEYYEISKRKLNWSPEAFFLSQKKMKNTIAVVYTKDTSGKIKMIVDANNNQDFSDDSIFYPPSIQTFSGLNDNDSLPLKNSISVNYERELNMFNIDQCIILVSKNIIKQYLCV